MKKKIVFSIIISISLLIGNFSPAVAALRSNPVPQMPTDQMDKYQTDLFTGSATYSYPIKVPKGTNDLTPDISISYNSGDAKSLNISGMGWQINQDYVERDTNFTPGWAGGTEDDKFKLHFKGAIYDLVYVSLENRYHTKIESHLNIQKLTTTNNTKGEYWQVITQDGTIYRFGYSTNSELICNGKNYNYNQSRDYVNKWNLDQVTDIRNNKIYYTYTSTDGFSYLDTIKYNNDQQREIDFTYSPNPSPRQMYIQGCNVKETSHINTIQVKANSFLIHQYDFGYTTSVNGQSQLQSITEKGSDGSSLPSTTFTYNPEVKAFQTTDEKWINNTQLDYTDLDRTDTTLIDVNGDGLPDIVRTYTDHGNNTWRVYMNLRNSWSTTYQEWLTNAPIDASLDRSDTRLIDVTGDGLPDIVKMHLDNGTYRYIIYRNTGTTWNTNGETWVSDNNFPAITDSKVQIIDVNGDGFADVVKSYLDVNNRDNWLVYKGNGSSWNTGAEIWLSSIQIDAHLDQSFTKLIDVTGDGLPDIVKSTYNGTNDTWSVWRNSGDSWSNTSETWLNNAPVDTRLDDSSTTFGDVNGDGLVDIIKVVENGTNDQWKVLLNQGTSWSTQYDTWLSGFDADLAGENNVRLVDVSGDGLADVLKTDHFAGGNATWQIWKNTAHAPDLLVSVHNPEGGTTSFDYTPSTQYSNVGTDSLSDLPFPLWLVSKMTVDNGMTNTQNTNDVTTYRYANGAYNWQNKEFRGFGNVYETDPNGAKKTYVFYQDDALKGNLNTLETSDSSNHLYARTVDNWANSQANGIYTNTLSNESQYTNDGSATNPKTTETDYQYDTYGNVTKKSELGDTSVTGDERYTYYEYAINSTAWIINTLKHTYLNGSDDSTKVSETWDYYDTNTDFNTAPTKGDLTKEVKWSNTTDLSNPTTTYQYDSYGNKTQETDANNHTTIYAYDSATHTYPVGVNNAKNQTTTTNYDLGTGNLLSKTDANGLTTSYKYDVFGRISEEIQPYDSSSSPTKMYNYLIDGTAPEGVVVSQREVSSASAMLNTFTFFDGLGRKIQTRQDAEDPTKQIVKDTFYDSSGQISKETVPYNADSTLSEVSSTPASPSATKFGDGSSGNLAITVNTLETPIDSSVTASANSTTATVGQGLAFSSNQIVLFHQTQGTNAGVWEFARVAGYSGTTLTLTQSLTNAYSSSGNNHAQVRVVPQYYNVTVYNGATWSAKPWNGSTGGILAFFAKGTVTINGTIANNGGNGGTGTNSAGGTGGGFRGGQGLSSYDENGYYGEGYPGPSGRTSGSYPHDNSNGNGGGAPSFNNSTLARSGAGGGNGTAGGTTDPATGGVVYGTTDLTTMTFGGGGGGGVRAGDAGTGDGGGGAGGGIIFISGSTITISGSITSNGGKGGADANNNQANGGGGAGGSILLETQTASTGANLITANGGQGYQGGGSGGIGNGGNGRIRVVYESSITGTTVPTASVAQAQIPLIPAGLAPLTLPINVSGIYVFPSQNTKSIGYTYDPIGRMNMVTNTDGTFSTIAYDHWKTTTIDENGHIKRQYRNAYGKINKIEEVNGIDTYTTTYEYDSRDLLTKITDHAGNTTTMTYDSLGDKLTQTSPDSGTWHYEYNGNGKVTKVTDNRGIAVTNTYDELDRIIKKDYPTDADTTFAYDIGKIGSLSIATDSAGTVNYAYDNRLRKTQEQRSVNGTTKTTSYAYDATDRMTSQTNPDGEVVTYAYNPQGEINSVSGTTNIVSNIDYNAQNKITKKDFANGLSTNYTYNTTDFRLNRIQTGTLQDMNYTYDSVGNVKTITDAIANKTQTFGYDDLDRLTTASESAGFNYQYQYNAIGNLTKYINGGTTTDYTYGENAGAHALTSSSKTSSVKTEGLIEDWSLGSINWPKWNNWGGSQVNVVNNQLKITSTSSSGYYGVASSGGFNLASSYVMNQLVDAGNQSITSFEAYPINISKDTDNQLNWYVNGGNIIAKKKIAGVQTILASAPYNPAIHKYFRIRESNGVIYWDYSTNGNAWTNFAMLNSLPFDITSVYMEEMIGTWQNEGSTTSATFDNFNIIPVTPAASSFSDDWSSGSIASKWNDWSSSHASVISNQINMTSAVSNTNGYYGLDSGKDEKVYDLKDSFAQNQLVNPGNLSISSWEVYPISIFKDSNPSYALHFLVSGSTLFARYSTPTGFTNIRTATFNSATQHYFRIRESKGNVYWETSADGQSWTYFTSMADPFDLTAVRVGMVVGTWQSESVTTAAIFDNFNVFSASISSVIDDWSEGYIEPSKWNNWGGSQVNVVNTKLKMNSTLASGYYGTSSTSRYNLTNSYIVNQLVDAGNQSITSFEAYPINISKDTDNQLSWYVTGGNIIAKKKVAGVQTILASATYNPAIHKYFRIRESNGVIYWDYSTNGNAWTNFTTLNSLPFEVTSVYAEQMIGTWQNEGSTTSATFDNFNVSPSVYIYDANGNMTSDGTTCYHYNEANQLDKVTSCIDNQTIAEYVYDYNGNRMIKKNYTNGQLANTVTSWGDSYETKDINGGGTENTTYYFANGQLIAKKNPDGSRYYIHSDHLGSTSVVTDQSGNLVESTKYDPWGEITSGGTKSKFLYTGQEKDSETNLNYYNARYYDSHIRRFTQPDDVIQDIYNPQMLNIYSYVVNNPLRYTDPTGRVVTCTAKGCSSSISILNSPPKKSTPAIYSYIPYYAAAVSKPSSSPAKSSGSGGGSSGGGNNSGGSGGNAAVAVAATLSKANLIRQNNINGNNFQNAIHDTYGFARNYKGLGEDYGNRIPDGLDDVVRECKASAYVCNTQQIKDMMRYASDKKLPFELYMKEGSRMSQQVEQAILNHPYGGSIITVPAGIVVPVILDSMPIFINTGIISPNHTNYESQQL